MLKYWRKKKNPPPALQKKHDEIIDEYRLFLNVQGMKMPKPKYPYICRDKRTHYYLYEPIVGYNFPVEIVNPNWKYKINL